jgi:hypothetical protein
MKITILHESEATLLLSIPQGDLPGIEPSLLLNRACYWVYRDHPIVRYYGLSLLTHHSIPTIRPKYLNEPERYPRWWHWHYHLLLPDTP